MDKFFVTGKWYFHVFYINYSIQFLTVFTSINILFHVTDNFTIKMYLIEFL